LNILNRQFEGFLYREEDWAASGGRWGLNHTAHLQLVWPLMMAISYLSLV
jgi:hypothetical protein